MRRSKACLTTGAAEAVGVVAVMGCALVARKTKMQSCDQWNAAVNGCQRLETHAQALVLPQQNYHVPSARTHAQSLFAHLRVAAENALVHWTRPRVLL
jgi:hypothetical protein